MLLNEWQVKLAHVAENMQSHMHSESPSVTAVQGMHSMQHGFTNTRTVGNDQLSDLQMKDESLTASQVNLEKVRERERRKC